MFASAGKEERRERGSFTRFVVHEEDDVRPLADHSKEFHHARRSEGAPRTHLLTAEPLQGDLWRGERGRDKRVSTLRRKKTGRKQNETKKKKTTVTFLTANLKPVLTS